MRFNFEFFISCFPELIKKMPFTLYLGILSFLASFILACVITILRNAKFKLIRSIVKLYISFFRSTPYITQLFIFYYGLPQLIPALRTMSSNLAFIISVALNSSAFITEIIRGGLLSVDKGQKEASLSIGMNKYQTLREVILPQALVSSLPALGNTFVGTVKNTAIAFTIGVVEILSQSKVLAAKGFNLVYWVLIAVLDLILQKIELKVNKFM